MFKHILLPTDGSPLSQPAIQKGVQFAKSIGARVTGFYVIQPYHLFSAGSGMMTDSKAEYEAHSRTRAEEFLDVISKAAKQAEVTSECVFETGDHPYAAIVKAAEARGCDLIMMASHGRRGVQALLIGSETNKVLTHTKIPVLVFR